MDIIHDLKKHGIISRYFIHTVHDSRVIEKTCFEPLYGAKSTHSLKIKAGTIIEPNFFKFIDSSLNESLDKKLFFEDEKSGAQALQFALINKVYEDYENYDSMCEGLKDICIKGNMYKKYEKKQQIHNQSTNKGR